LSSSGDDLGGLPYESAELPEHENTAADMPTGIIPSNTKPVKTSTPDSTAKLAEQALANERLPASPQANAEQPDVPSDNDSGSPPDPAKRGLP
jgi:hypothetical protein